MQTASSPPRQKWQEAKVARWQSLLRIQQILQEFRVLLHQLVAAVERGASLLAQFFNLVANALLSPRDRALDRRIDLSNRFVQTLQAFLQLSKVAVELA